MKKLLLLFGFLCLGMVSVNAQEYGLCGYVTDGNGKPISKAEVSLKGFDSNPENKVVLNTYSDENGYYFINVNPDGTWYSTATCGKDGYKSVDYDVMSTFKGEGLISHDFVLEKESKGTGIFGYVKDTSGNPINNASLTLWCINLSGEEVYEENTYYTNDEGYFELFVGLQKLGRYQYFIIEAEGFEPLKVDFADLSIEMLEMVEYNFTLEKKASDGLKRIRGIVKDEQGNPLSDVEISVTLRALVGEGPEAVLTDADGKYVIELPEGYFGNEIYWITAYKSVDEGAYGKQESFIPISGDVTEVDLTLLFDENLLMDNFDYRNEYLVLDIETGEPIPGATVQEFYRHYEHDNGIQKGEMFLTDEIGCYTTDNRISEDFCWHPSYVMAKATDYGTEKVFCNFTGGSGLSGGLEQVIIYMKREKCSEDGGFPDGINMAKVSETSVKHYSVSGVEVLPSTKGIHIVNGKKVIVK